ncbi:uncharacterized protein LOC105662369 isoform X2 [Megachile rotundata]|uniref:uncharacterized protein LOC105662369 isoform X2 n=1 Tax=Megachile rotundata TaxID=143995 RepID=UPI003FD27B7A
MCTRSPVVSSVIGCRSENAMNGTQTIVCLCLVITLNMIRAEENTDPNEDLRYDISQGITLRTSNNKTSIVIRMSTLFKKSDEQRNMARLKFKKGIFQRIGMAVMMFPLMIQMVSLPATLASIKLTLIRSLVVGKIALAIMFYNAIRNSQKSEVVLVHRPEYHEHYYHTYHQPEDDDEGWFGR